MCLIYAATVKKMVYTCLLEDTIMYNKSYIYIKKHVYCILTMVKVLFVIFTQFNKGVIIKKILCTVTNVFNLLHKIVKQLII